MINYKKYFKYINGGRWENRREQYWDNHDRDCYVCGEFALELHHRIYDNLGDEKDSDLVPLCEDCHEEVHIMADVGEAPLYWCHAILSRAYNDDDLKLYRRLTNLRRRKCPRCSGYMRLRKGKYGEFFGCSNYPKCKAIIKK